MSAIVIDASCMVAAAWEQRELGEWFRDSDLIAPTVFWNEVVNAGLVMSRRGRITINEAHTGLWESMEMVSPTHAVTPPIILDLAYETGLSAYDAAYLAHAIALSLPLATFDQKLRKAAADAGVPVLP